MENITCLFCDKEILGIKLATIDEIYVCQSCGAIFWLEDDLKTAKQNAQNHFKTNKFTILSKNTQNIFSLLKPLYIIFAKKNKT